MGLSDADREALYSRLKAHAAAETISMPELERRVELVGRAETAEQAAAAVDDLPKGVPGGGPPTAAPVSARPRWGQGHGDAAQPGADWRATAERFRDPRSGRIMRVWEDPAGQRHYVPDE